MLKVFDMSYLLTKVAVFKRTSLVIRVFSELQETELRYFCYMKYIQLMELQSIEKTDWLANFTARNLIYHNLKCRNCSTHVSLGCDS